jgi:hypothetical protein
MNSDPLDPLLHAYARRSLPAASEQLVHDVRRTIQLRRTQPFWARLFPILDWRDLFGEPRLIVSALAVALAVGVLPAVLAGRQPDPRLARESLHFEVFSPVAPAIFNHLADQPPAADAVLSP